MDGPYYPQDDCWSNGQFWIRFREETEPFDTNAGWIIQFQRGLVAAFRPQLVQVLPATGSGGTAWPHFQIQTGFPQALYCI